MACGEFAMMIDSFDGQLLCDDLDDDSMENYELLCTVELLTRDDASVDPTGRISPNTQHTTTYCTTTFTFTVMYSTLSVRTCRELGNAVIDRR
jgi:hypothetical protein